MFVAGIDAHATYSVTCVVSKQGQLVAGPTRIKNADADQLTELLEPYRPLEVVVETGAGDGAAIPDAGFEGAGEHWTVSGDLTIKRETRPITLDVEYHGVVSDPWGGRRAAFSAFDEINREDWGLTWNVALEAGGVLVGPKVRLEIETQGVLQADKE